MNDTNGPGSAGNSATPVSPVQAQFFDLGATIDRLNGIVGQLTKRLEPVMVPKPLTAVAEDQLKAPQRVACQVEQCALDAGVRIHILNEDLSMLLDRLQI